MPVATVTLLAGFYATAGSAPGITCPDGYTIIVKHLSVRNRHNATQLITLNMMVPGMETTHVALQSSVGADLSAQSDTWIALEAGSIVWVSSTLGPYTYWVSGSLLSGEAPPVIPLVDIVLPGQLPGLPIESGLTVADKPRRKR